MRESRRVWALLLIMALVGFTVGGLAIGILYGAALDEQRVRLMETVQSQSRLLEAVARFDQIYSNDFPEGATAATLSQVVQAHHLYKGLGETGEFVLGRLEGERIQLILERRHGEPTAWLRRDAPEAEPLRRALAGHSGAMELADYRGRRVLAAYEPVAILDLGFVAKIDIDEIAAPFLRAAAYAFGVGLVILLAGAALFLRVSNPIVRELRHSQDRLRQLTQRLEEAREEERKWISHEIHDEMGGSLAKIRMDLHWLAKRLPLHEAKQRQRLSDMQELVDETIQTVRRITSSLRPVILDKFGLMAAIDWLAEDFQKHSGIRCMVRCAEPRPRLADRQETALFRICQEALTNVSRHAQAANVWIDASLDADGFRLSVADDGRGMPQPPQEARLSPVPPSGEPLATLDQAPASDEDPDQERRIGSTEGGKPSSALGLHGMRERLQPFGGTLEILSRQPSGVELVALLPNPVLASHPANPAENPTTPRKNP